MLLIYKVATPISSEVCRILIPRIRELKTKMLRSVPSIEIVTSAEPIFALTRGQVNFDSICKPNKNYAENKVIEGGQTQ